MSANESISLASAFDQSDQAFCVIRVILNDAGKPCDWEFAYLNDALARIEGLPKEQLLHRRFFEVFPQADTKWFDYYYPAAYEGKSCTVKEVSEEIGMYLRIHCFPVAHGYCGCILEDISELETSLRREHEGDTLIRGLAKSYDMVWLIKAPQMTMHLYRAAQTTADAELSGSTYAAGMALWIARYVHEEDQARLMQETTLDVVQAAIRESGALAVNYRRCEGGAVTYEQIDFASVEGSDSFVMAFRNVNEIVEAQQRQEQVLQEALTSAQQANRAKTAFLSNMSHDIRTPMNAIIGFTALAKTHIHQPEQLRSDLNKIETSSRHLLALINDVLDMSRIEANKLSLEEVTFSLKEVLNELHSILSADIAAKQHHFTMDTTQLENDLVICDRLRLGRILLNIMSNAVKFTHPGGRISVHASESAGVYTFRVKDTGIGMSKEFVKHLFEPFERERTSTVSGIQGTGLGMAIAHSMVQMLDGEISVTSELGVGSEFVVTLPLKHAEQTPSAQPEAAPPDAQPLTGKRLLLVEDNALNREIAVTLLTMQGFTVETAIHGQAALDRLTTPDALPIDLVLMDIQMPVMDGYEAARAIRALNDPRLSRLPIIAMTANAFDEDIRRTHEAGMDAHIAKPIDMDRLLTTLRQLLT